MTKKAAGTGAVLETETYRHDANNNVVDQTVDNTRTRFAYDRNRLTSATAAATPATYNYDPFGRLDSVLAAGQIIESYTYDGFDRTATHKATGSGGALTTWLGEVEGIGLTLTYLRQKREETKRLARIAPVELGMMSLR